MCKYVALLAHDYQLMLTLHITNHFKYLKWRYSTLFTAILGVGKLPYISRIHTAYIGEDSSILGTNEMFGDTESTLPHHLIPWKSYLEDHPN